MGKNGNPQVSQENNVSVQHHRKREERMNQISLLSQDTIDKIAAGEVVERPASIVKELVENAVDAGANAVTVEIKDGGISLIRITDNGSGIPKDQVQVAFLRHATSKIRTVDDLLTSGTLGFRGEALSSIAAVCQVEMITKTAGSLTGVRYVIEGGVEKSLEEIGAPEGTTFLVRNLFYHTPARKKFLKSAATEAGYVSDLMERMALSHPEISFKFINNRDTKLHTSGNSSLKDVVYGIYGREIAANVVRIDTGTDRLKVSGFIGKPVISRGNRNYENYFVNGRYVKSAIIARAIEDAYKPFMMSHRYPFTVLKLDIDAQQVDVNVHPTKMEVRFASQSEVYDMVYQAVKEGLLARELIPEFTIDTKNAKDTKNLKKEIEKETKNESDSIRKENGSLQEEQKPVSVQETFQKKERISYPEPFEKIRSQLLAEAKSPYEVKYPERNRRTGVMRPVTGNIGYSGSAEQRKTQEPDHAAETVQMRYGTVRTEQTAGAKASDAEDRTVIRVNSDTVQDRTAVSATEGTASGESKTVVLSDMGLSGETDSLSADTAEKTTGRETVSVPDQEKNGKPVQMELFDDRLLSGQNIGRHKLIGQVFDTYWLVEFQDKLYIIDQHAAHEKVLYERFMKSYEKKEQTSQMITPPLIVTLTMQEEEKLRQNMDHFRAVGFEIEHFGGKEYSIRAVPGNLYGIADRTLFLELLDGLTDVSERASAEAICEKIASMSCKAAVKGNQKLSAAEADALIAELLELENPYNCPHGRPTIISMTKYEMEKKFKRIV